MKKIPLKTGAKIYFSALGCVCAAIVIQIGIGILGDGPASCQFERSLCNRGLVFAGLMFPTLVFSLEAWHQKFGSRERRRRTRKPNRKDLASSQADEINSVPAQRATPEQPPGSPPRRDPKPPSLW